MNKIFIFMFLILGLSVSVNAVLDDGEYYYSYQYGDFTDLTGNNRLVINYGTSNTTGYWDSARSYDGSNDYVIEDIASVLDTTMTISVWTKNTFTGSSKTIVSRRLDPSNNQWQLYQQGSADKIYMVFYNGVNTNVGSLISTSNINDGDWHNIIVTQNGNTAKLYIDGTLEDTDTTSGKVTDTQKTTLGAYYEGTGSFYDGQIDEVTLYDRELSSTEVSSLFALTENPYASELPILTYSNILANNATLINNSYFNNTILFETIVFNTSTNGNVDHSYELNRLFENQTQLVTNGDNLIINSNNIDTYCSQQGLTDAKLLETSSGSNTAYWTGSQWVSLTSSTAATSFSCLNSTATYTTNSLNGSVNITLDDDKYLISFKAINDETSVSSTNFSFIVDKINPTITNNIPSEINSYDFNGSLFSCNDENLLSCTISIDGSIINAGTPFIVESNGNLPYNITSTDLAGNQLVESGSVYVNPFIYLYFNNIITTNSIANYTLGGVTVIGTEYKEKYFTLYNGSSSIDLSFVKQGYFTTDVKVIMVSDETINETFDISPVTLFIRVYDSETLNQINFNLTLQNSIITSFTNLVVYNQSFPNIPLGDVTIRVSKDGYSDGTFFTTLSGDSAVAYNVYLTPENLSSVVAFNVKNFDDNSLLGGVLVEARQIINDEIVTVQQTITGSNGVAFLNLDASSNYEYIFTKDGFVRGNINAVPGVITYTVRLRSESTIYEYLDDITVRVSPTRTVIYGGDLVDFNVFISGSSLTQTNISIIDNFDNVLYTDTSTNPTGTTFDYSKQFLNDTNITTVTMNIQYILEGNTKYITRTFNVFSLADSGVKKFDDFGNDTDEESKLFRFFVIITTFASFIILGARGQQTRDFVSLITVIPLIIFTFVGWIPYLYATIMFLVMIVFFMGGNKR